MVCATAATNRLTPLASVNLVVSPRSMQQHQPLEQFMRNSMPRLWVAVAAALLDIASSGCGRQGEGQSKITTIINDRKVRTVMDVVATSEMEGGAVVFRFGANRLSIEKDRVLLDGTERARIPAEAKDIQVVLSEGTLTVSAEGANVLTTKVPIQR